MRYLPKWNLNRFWNRRFPQICRPRDLDLDLGWHWILYRSICLIDPIHSTIKHVAPLSFIVNGRTDGWTSQLVLLGHLSKRRFLRHVIDFKMYRSDLHSKWYFMHHLWKFYIYAVLENDFELFWAVLNKQALEKISRQNPSLSVA